MTDPSSQPFLMAVENFLAIPGRGLRAAGRIESGTIRPGDTVEVVGRRPTASFAVAGIGSASLADLERAQAGDTIVVQLRDAAQRDVEHGDVLASPGTIEAHAGFSADIHLLSKEEGGRHTPIFADIQGQFFFHGRAIGGSATFPDGAEMLWPGSDVRLEVALSDRAAMNIGQRFTVRQGGRMLGSGIVSSITR